MKELLKKWAQTLARLWKYEELPENEVEAYKANVRNARRRQVRRWLFIGGLALAVILIVFYALTHIRYSSYEVREDTTTKKTDNVSEYLTVGDYILRYSSDGVSLLDNDLSSRWNVTYTMEDPRADVCGTTILLYDKNSTSLMIFDRDGRIGSFESDKPIIKARVSSAGNVVMLLDDGENALIRYCSAEGSTIASVSASVSAEGYPADFDVSENGLYLTVSYMYPQGSTLGSHLVFYDFSVNGSSYDDNILLEETYDGVLIPEVYYEEGTTLVANREDGFSVYSGSTPKKIKDTAFEKEIISTFRTTDRSGYIFAADEDDEEGSEYRIEFYDKNGNLKNSLETDFLYDRVNVSGDQLLLTNDSALCVVAENGSLRFSGTLDEGIISSVLHLTGNQYLLVTNSKTEIIILK